MKHWPTKPLGEVLEVGRERIEPTEHPDTLFNYIGLESIEGHTGKLLTYQPTPGADIKSTKNVFHSGQILYGKLRPYLNKVHLANEDGICSTDIYVLQPRQQRIHSSFVAYYLRSPAVLAVVSNAMAGANLPRISQEALLAIPVPIPPLAEQERLVKLLEEADALRKLRAQADRRAADLIPALFYEMFGDPEKNSLGWPSVTLEEVISSTKLGLVRGAKETDNSLPFPYVRMDAILGDGSLALAPIKRVNATAAEVAEFSLRDGDFLFNTRNSRELVGKTAIFEGSGTYVFNNNIMRIRFNDSVEPHYMIALFQTDFIKRQLEARKSGTTS
ncbi:MAG: restriction endonuclease subunit S, partial [Pseudolabrys sp.]|nr:restriction endonuclease subunit S [Pseudolabrys sp.]